MSKLHSNQSISCDPCKDNHFLVTTIYWIKWYVEMKDHS